MGNLLRNCFSSSQSRHDSDLDLIPDSDNIDSSESSAPPNPDVLLAQHNLQEAQSSQQQPPPLYYLAPGVGRRVDQLSEEEQIKIAKRIGLIAHLPVRVFSEDEKDKNWECVICMVDYVEGDRLRCLPCTHTYHKDCIDDWLMRSFTCPSCNQPVDAALLTTFSSLAAMP